MSAGYIWLHRSITDWEWYKDANTSRVFFHLVLTANFRDTRAEGTVIPRGSLIVKVQSSKGEPSLCGDLSLSVQEVRTALEHLKKTGEITVKTTNRNTLIKVINYNFYQSGGDDSNNQINNPVTTKQQPINNLLTTNTPENGVDSAFSGGLRSKEYKEVKKKDLKTSCPTPCGADVRFGADSFEYKASRYLADQILANNPKARVPRDLAAIQKWCVHIDRMKRLDNRSEGEIRSVLAFAVKDVFWSTVVLSTENFRKNFDQLFAKMSGAGGHGGPAQKPKHRFADKGKEEYVYHDG